MMEITFKIEHQEDCDVVTICENGNVRQIHRYHPGTEESVLVLETALTLYGLDKYPC